MQTDRVFNTRFEVSLRLLILLSRAGDPIDLEFIQVIDFVATYGKTFSLADDNVHGDNQYMFGERLARFRRVEDALRELVLEGCVQPIASDRGMLYRLTQLGEERVASLESDYARRYADACERAIEDVEHKSLKAVIREIHRLEKRPLQEVAE
ncbi:ABC-three component system middle component 2 [Gordonibacter sp. Marseille-P4307]|uniref:ABC-three component system middle component 2 n=1 Tax=Gordonibacter sp. Marseille-P4307 TaxID=2161815 RepID=UPI000F540181|nr:ABC-three component system middle component 2 [Gordonibacter sp. Marseille-P4307]